MSQIQIILPEDTTKKLKILAVKSGRSLKKLIELYLNKATDLNLIDINERTGEMVVANANSQSQTNPLTSLTFEQLQQAGITHIPKQPKTLTLEEQEVQNMKLWQQKEKLRTARVDYFKKKCKEIYPYFRDTWPAALRPAAIDYILLKHPDNASLDKYIDDDLARLTNYDLDNSEYEFYLYEPEIEAREKRLIIPIEQNEIYKNIKDYCLKNDLSDELYHINEYPDGLTFEDILYTLTPVGDSDLSHSALYKILDLSVISEQDVINALIWK